MKAEHLMIQNLCCPIGITTKRPIFSYWISGGRITEENRWLKQSAFRIVAASSMELLNKDCGDLWDSGVERQKETFGIQYNGKELVSGQRVYWKVRVWDENKAASDWSEAAFFEMGLLEKEDWKGVWIGQGDNWTGNKSAAPQFVCDFTINDIAQIEAARLYISGLGIFYGFLNGKKLADTFFEPGESDAGKSVYYVTCDITKFLSEGINTLGVILGNGQYCGFLENPVMAKRDGTPISPHRYQKNDGGFVKPEISGEKKLIAQVELLYQNGTRKLAAVSNESWLWKESPVIFQNWYGGEDYDACKEESEWNLPGGSRSGWNQAVQMCPPSGQLIGREFLPVKIMEKLSPYKISRLSNGNWLVDMGRNGAGFPEISLETTEKQRGMWIKMYPAELVKTDGICSQTKADCLIGTVDQSSCTQSWNERYQCVIMDSYCIKGNGREVWHPLFCYHGFQYLEIEGWPGELTKENIRYCIVRTANEKNSEFFSDNILFNQVNTMIEHSMESNMFSAFTDCPQIEKLGWIETSHLMFRSLAGTYDVSHWMRKILHDIADSQHDREQAKLPDNEPEGFVPAIIPEYQRICGLHKDPNWNGACVFTPWEYYQYYGDKTVLYDMYPIMKKYLKYLQKYVTGGVLDNYAQMGEWGQLNENTPTVLVATCAYYRLLDIVGKTAEITGHEEEAKEYFEMAEKTKKAFHKHSLCYNEADGIYGNGSQASYGCVLFSGLVPKEREQETVDKLVKAVQIKDYHLTSGEVGLKQVFLALAEHGKNDVVYKMIMNETSPSYRAFVDRGFTTLPEYWNCDELWNGMERSRNHAMMGHAREWIICGMLGIRSLEPGFGKIKVEPYLPPDMKEIRGSITCPYGKIEIKCKRKPEGIEVGVSVPVGVEIC